MSEKTILVADDETHILNVVSLKLRNAGFRVLTAHDGQEALDVALAALVRLLAFVARCSCIRPAAFFPVAMSVGGSIACRDAGAEPFFLRYALPLLKRQQATDSPVRQAVRCLTAAPAELPTNA